MLHYHTVTPAFGTYRTINRVGSALGARADVYLLASLASNEERAARVTNALSNSQPSKAGTSLRTPVTGTLRWRGHLAEFVLIYIQMEGMHRKCHSCARAHISA